MIENKFIVIILACLICSCSMSSIQATQTAIDKDKENTNRNVYFDPIMKNIKIDEILKKRLIINS